MFGLQTLSCLHDIPVIRSSTDTIQNVYAKAKQTSPLIRLPCDLAETVADKSLQVALNVVNPLVKPLSGPVRAIDNYAAEKLREIETRYPVINTRAEDVVTTFNERTEPVRNAVNSVRDTTTSTIQHGKETVVNVASGVANSVFSFCGNRQGYQGQFKQLNGCIFSTARSLVNSVSEKLQSTLLWFRLLVMFFLRKITQINEIIITNINLKAFTPAFVLKFFIVLRGLLKYIDTRISLSDKEIAELKKTRQQSRYNQQQYYPNRQSSKSNSSTTVRQRTNNVYQSPTEFEGLTDVEEVRTRLGNPDLTESTYDVDTDDYANELHARLRTTDVERLYSRLPTDFVPVGDKQGVLNADQQQLHARLNDD